MTKLPDWLDPWSANRRLRQANAGLIADLKTWVRVADLANEQYHRIRDANAEMRQALQMVRDSNHKLWAENSALHGLKPAQLTQQYDTEFSAPPEDK